MMLATWGKRDLGPRCESLTGLSTRRVVNVHFAWVAQSVEQRTRNAQVVGSSPTSGSKFLLVRALTSVEQPDLSQQLRLGRTLTSQADIAG
jgi:hypothetical protein